MSRLRFIRRGERRACGLSASGLAWHDAQGAVHEQDATTGLGRLLGSNAPGTVVDVIASNELAAHWLQVPPRGVRSLAELRLVATLRCAHLFGGTPQQWWVAGDWNLHAPFACAALPVASTTPLQQQADSLGARLRWHTAWGVVASTRARSFPDDGWSASRSHARLVVWQCRRGRIDALWSVAAPPHASVEEDTALAQAIARMDADEAAAVNPYWVDLRAGWQPGHAPGCVTGLSEAGAAAALAPLLEDVA